MGVLIVVPAKKILEVLYHPELVAMRKEFFDKTKKTNESSTTTDSAFPKPFTKDDFEAALRKVTRKITPQK
jgi:hypothetical protein